MGPGDGKFRKRFFQLTGWEPLRWQERLYDKFTRGDIPGTCDLPTGAGKTAVMALWFLARSAGAPLPRRLLYVVDRRAVVDQATAVAEKIAERAGGLAISTLRGKFLDNGRWREDPSAPAVIVGTVDMAGSRILFSGYGVSRKMRPFQAGLLGADTLIVLDEAHLIPPFEHLVGIIASDRGTFGPRCRDGALVPCTRLLSLSATGRGRTGAIFRLEPEDLGDKFIAAVVGAKKSLRVVALGEKETLAEQAAARAADLAGSSGRCLVYCDKRLDAGAIANLLRKCAPGVGVELLVGARRVRERQAAARRIGQLGFLAGAPRASGPVFLVATAAGEVGVDLDADCMVCDVVPWERMVQRLGRVNRRGSGGRVAQIEVLDAGAEAALQAAHRKRRKEVEEPEGKKKSEAKTGPDSAELSIERQCATLRLLDLLPPSGRDHLASPEALAKLREEHGDQCEAASTPEPLRPQLTRAAVEAWSLTSLREHPGRPEPGPWLRGWTRDEPQACVIWRAFLPVRPAGPAVSDREVERFFAAAPPKASEILETEAWAVTEWVEKRAAQTQKASGKGPPGEGDVVAFVLNRGGDLKGSYTLLKLASLGKKDRRELTRAISEHVLILDARLGGLSTAGLLDEGEAAAALAADAAGPEEWGGAAGEEAPPPGFRVRRWRRDEAGVAGDGWRERYRFVLRTDDGGDAEWLAVEKPPTAEPTDDDDPAERDSQLLDEHVATVEAEATRLARELELPADCAEALRLAARLHDEGKRAPRWQAAFHAPNEGIYGKTKGPINQALLGGYRHEFGSLLRAEPSAELAALSEEMRDLVLHVIAAHHGWARPTIGAAGCEDHPPSVLRGQAREAALRFARLQRQWGPWGLAWWEALLRAADQRASLHGAKHATVAVAAGGDGNG